MHTHNSGNQACVCSAPHLAPHPPICSLRGEEERGGEERGGEERRGEERRGEERRGEERRGGREEVFTHCAPPFDPQY